jgi:hypothetical protein
MSSCAAPSNPKPVRLAFIKQTPQHPRNSITPPQLSTPALPPPTAHRPSRTHHISRTTSFHPICAGLQGTQEVSSGFSTHAFQLYYVGCRLSLCRCGGVHTAGADYKLKMGEIDGSLTASLTHPLACFERRRLGRGYGWR